MSRIDEANRIKPSDIKDRYEEIYSRYTRLTRNGNKLVGLCPFHNEQNGSFNIFDGGAYKCFGCEAKGGSVIDFIMAKENLTFPEALEFASKDFNISPSKTIKVRKKIVKEEPLIEVQKISFERKHKDYWNRYLLPEDYLNSEGVWAISKYAINKHVYTIPEDVATFAYEAGNKYKLLQIGNTDKKWINWVPNNYIWRENKVKDCKQLWVVKSLKDALILNYHAGLCTVALQNESAEIFLKENADRMENITKDIVIALGVDPQGKAESIKITQERGYKWWNVPNYMYKYDIEDGADLVDQLGVQPLKELLKNKGYL